MAIEAALTYVGSIQNQRQVCDGPNSFGNSASKIWNAPRWTADRLYYETGEIPGEGVLKSYTKNQAYWNNLHAQSIQKIIEELSGAFWSWFDLRQIDAKANQSDNRQYGDTRLCSTVTFKSGRLQVRPRQLPRLALKTLDLKES